MGGRNDAMYRCQIWQAKNEIDEIEIEISFLCVVVSSVASQVVLTQPLISMC